MRIGLSALSAVALAAGIATAAVAQTPSVPSNPNTKVYAYKQTAPKPTNPSAMANPSTAPRLQKPFEHLPDSVPYGTAAWWQEMARMAGGDGGQ
jgi:ABC-type oligopeptide transport system substrate-binding subunit